MLKIPDGILNVILGKLVPVTNYGRTAENIFAPARANKGRNTSFRGTTQKEKIKVCNEFTRAFSGKNFFNKTFPCHNEPGTGINKAINIIMDVGITGSYPHSRISYPQVLVSKGLLPGAENAAAADNEEHNILFSWADNTGAGIAKATDKVILVAYFPAVKKAIYSVDAALRKDCRAYLETTSMEGFNAETWIGFMSEDEKDAANSRYTGTIYL